MLRLTSLGSICGGGLDDASTDEFGQQVVDVHLAKMTVRLPKLRIWGDTFTACNISVNVSLVHTLTFQYVDQYTHKHMGSYTQAHKYVEIYMYTHTHTLRCTYYIYKKKQASVITMLNTSRAT